ncbi:hypothetical protein GE21DRAFT_1312422 [Neurospora crassa]|nr:hypothetical protein GE21DRAFT_1312422 [Neurospora crassa]
MVISAHTMPEVDASTDTDHRVVPVVCHLTQDKAVSPEKQCEFSARVVMGIASVPRVIDKISGSAT